MARLVVDHGMLQESAAVTAGIAQDMHDARTRLGRRVDGLCGAGWSGSTASAFRSAMSEWDAGAAEVMDALHRLGGLIAAADRGFAGTDAVTSGLVQAAGAGLGEGAGTGSAAGQGASGETGSTVTSGAARGASVLNL